MELDELIRKYEELIERCSGWTSICEHYSTVVEYLKELRDIREQETTSKCRVQ